MIKVTLITEADSETFMTSENKTVREILDEQEINIQGCTITIDGYTMRLPDLGQTLAELGITERTYIGVTHKSENAAAAVLIGEAFVVTSGLKLEDIEMIAKYRPDELTLYKGEGKEKEPVFAVEVGEKSAMNKYGITFGKTASPDGKARATIPFAGNPEEAADKYGAGIMALEKLEAKLTGVAEAVKAERAAIKEKIVVS